MSLPARVRILAAPFFSIFFKKMFLMYICLLVALVRSLNIFYLFLCFFFTVFVNLFKKNVFDEYEYETVINIQYSISRWRGIEIECPHEYSIFFHEFKKCP